MQPRFTRRLQFAVAVLFAVRVLAAGPLVPYLVEDLSPVTRPASSRLHFATATLGEVATIPGWYGSFRSPRARRGR